MYHSFLIHLSADGHLGCFHVLDIINIYVIYFENEVNVSCSVVSDSAIPWTIANQAPLSIGFSRQEYWSG